MDVTAKNAPEILPLYNAHNYDHTHEWKVTEGEPLYSGPDDDKPILASHDFEEEIEGTIEYSVGVWARWLTTYPKRILKKDGLYSSRKYLIIIIIIIVFRLANRKNYKDFSDMGDRVFASWVGKGNYIFSTYDRI